MKLNLNVLYEDNHLIAVYKLAGILVQRDIADEPCLLDEVKEYIKEKYNKPGDVFLGLVHRLDRQVSGVMVFARTSKGASRLSEQIRNRTFKKNYHALVENSPKQPSGTLVHYLIKDSEKNFVTAFEKEKPNSLRAELFYEVVKTNNKNSLVKIELKTGRPHQIRVQMSAIGCPIVGDDKYGAKQKYLKNAIALCATSITFKLATKDEIKTVSIPIPEEFNF
jgi:23S rRNA pseudouridine1911/1915/1917 synthase